MAARVKLSTTAAIFLLSCSVSSANSTQPSSPSDSYSQPLRALKTTSYPENTKGYIVGQNFDSRDCIKLLNKTQNGVKGVEIVCPFQLSFNNNILVNYGWHPENTTLTSFKEMGFTTLKGVLKSPASQDKTDKNIYSLKQAKGAPMTWWKRDIASEEWYWTDPEALQKLFNLRQLNQNYIFYAVDREH